MDQLNIVIKGFWKLNIDEHKQDFIYKKVKEIENEDLLTELYCDNPDLRVGVAIGDKNSFNASSLQSYIDKMFCSQGKY